MEKSDRDQNAATLQAEPPVIQTREQPFTTQNSVAINAPKEERIVATQQSKTKGQTLRLLGTLGIGVAIGAGGAAYAFLHAGNQEKTAETQTQPATSSLSENQEEIPDTGTPKTPEHLRQTLKKYKIRMTAEMFPTKYRLMSSAFLVEEKTTDGDAGKDATYSWQPIDSKKFDQAILIATRIEKSEYDRWMEHIGIQPVTTVTDENDPNIRYHLYICSPNKNPLSRGAAIVVRQPTNRKKYLATLEMTLPLCTEKETPQ